MKLNLPKLQSFCVQTFDLKLPLTFSQGYIVLCSQRWVHKQSNKLIQALHRPGMIIFTRFFFTEIWTSVDLKLPFISTVCDNFLGVINKSSRKFIKALQFSVNVFTRYLYSDL